MQAQPGPGEVAIEILLQKQSAGVAFSLCWAERIAALQVEMGHETAPPVERMLIQHVALCYLQLNLIGMQYAEVIAGNAAGMTIERASFWDRRMGLAQRRLTRATEALERLRALTAAARYATARAEVAEAERGIRQRPRALTA